MAPGKRRDTDHTVGYSADYYKKMENELDVLTLTQRVYKDSSERLQIWIKELWYR